MFARTERLVLRPAWPEDAPAIAQAIGHEGVAMKLARVPWPYGLSDAQAWATMPRRATDPTSLIVAHEGEHAALIGAIGIDLDGEDGPELGYWLTPSAWGRGYATEAGRAVIANARHSLRLRRLVSGHFLDNPASGRVLQKLGFVPTGRIVQRRCVARRTQVPTATYTLDLADEVAPEGRMAA